MSKSPFYIVPKFISPLLCEQIVDGLNFIEPDVDSNDNPVLTIKSHQKFEQVLFHYTQRLTKDLEKYYNVEYKGTKPFEFKWYPTDCKEDPITCDNAIYLKETNAWVKNKDRDLSGIIFLSDYNDKVPFDSMYEVYGGKYEFPSFNFGFQAQRGTLIIYPSGPNFSNAVSSVLFGDLFLAKFHIATKQSFIYNPTLFPGNPAVWFKNL